MEGWGGAGGLGGLDLKRRNGLIGLSWIRWLMGAPELQCLDGWAMPHRLDCTDGLIWTGGSETLPGLGAEKVA